MSLILVVDAAFFTFRDGAPFGGHPDVLVPVEEWKLRAAAIQHVLGLDVTRRWSRVVSVDGKACPRPGVLWDELRRKGVVVGPETRGYATERLREVAQVIRRLSHEEGEPAEVIVLSPSTGLGTFRPVPGTAMRRPCSRSWLRYSLARGHVSLARVKVPAWKAAVADLQELVPAEHELLLSGDQGLVVRRYDEWRGLAEPQQVRAVVLVRTTPPWCDGLFQELLESAGVESVEEVGPGSPLTPREWDRVVLPPKALEQIAALPRRVIDGPIPEGIVVEHTTGSPKDAPRLHL